MTAIESCHLGFELVDGVCVRKGSTDAIESCPVGCELVDGKCVRKGSVQSQVHGVFQICGDSDDNVVFDLQKIFADAESAVAYARRTLRDWTILPDKGNVFEPGQERLIVGSRGDLINCFARGSEGFLVEALDIEPKN